MWDYMRRIFLTVYDIFCVFDLRFFTLSSRLGGYIYIYIYIYIYRERERERE